jgi:hypothetical protein
MARPVAVPASAARPTARATPREAAWLAAAPCALLVVAIVLALGPRLGEALFTPQSVPSFWPQLVAGGALRPEPTEHARYLLALLGPLLLVAATALGAGRLPSDRRTALLARVGQAALLAAAAGCLIGQHVLRSGSPEALPRVYFTWATLVIACLVAAAIVAVVRNAALLERVRPVVRETSGRRIAALALAVVFVVLSLLPAINTEGSIGTSDVALFVNIPFWLDETFGVLDGRAPLATFEPQYSQLWPYVAAAAMSIFGASYTVFAAAMATASGAAMLAVFATLRRIVRRSLLALALFVPFVATSCFLEAGSIDNRWSAANAFSMFPMRYGGPYLLLWLTVRQLDGARPRGRAALFAVAWVVAINNVEFGVPAFAACLAAVLATAGRPTWRLAGRLARELLLGLAAALVLVSALTLLVAGRLPDADVGRLFVFSRLYGVYGFGNLPISPAVGVHLAIYGTYAAAIAVAAVRALEGRDEPALTGALAWAGVFGLGTGAYFTGRSHPDVLVSLFSPWALALALLAVVAVRSMVARPSRLPSPAELAVLLGIGIAVCSVVQTPRPWQEARRIAQSTPTPAFRSLAQERFVADATRPGERIAILGPLGHRIAYDVGVVDAMPYATLESMPTRELLDGMLAGLQREGVRKLFLLLSPTTLPEHLQALKAGGWREVARSESAIELRD